MGWATKYRWNLGSPIVRWLILNIFARICGFDKAYDSKYKTVLLLVSRLGLIIWIFRYFICICIYIYIHYIHTYIYNHRYIYIYTWIYIYVYIYTHVYVYIYVYIYIYIYTHINMYTYIKGLWLFKSLCIQAFLGPFFWAGQDLIYIYIYIYWKLNIDWGCF